MKEIELKLISELMKDSRRSDRELAKALEVSQPTVTRLRSKLEKEDVIKEYTMIPDFVKLGFNLMSIMMFKLKPLSDEKIQELHNAARELDDEQRMPYVMIMSGIGFGKNVAVLSFHQDYGAYAAHIRDIKNAAYSRMKPFMDFEGTESFLIDLNYMHHYQPLTFSKLVDNLQKKKTTLQQSTNKKLGEK